MKKFHCILGVLCTMLGMASQAQTPYLTQVSNDKVTVTKGNITLRLTLDLGEDMIRTQHQRILTPVLRSADGNHQADFPPVIISGHNRHLKNLRDHATDTLQAFAYLQGNKQANRIVNYQAGIPFATWMEQARLELHEEVTGCASCGLQEAQHLINPQAIYAPQIKLSTQMECPEEFVARHEERDAYLIYPVNQTVLYADRYGNRSELMKIDSALTFVQRNPAYEIRRIDITGYASPEGTYNRNIALAEGRAEALKKHILKNYPSLDQERMHVTPGAENWEGLQEALENMELPYKDEIMRLAASDMEPDSREAEIRKIDGGQPYQILLRTIYPGLRKNTFSISYISRERTPDEAHRLVFSQPQELNVYEFYKVAKQFYANDRHTYNRILMIAADTYPQHPIANHNAACAALETGHWDKADTYLQRILNEAGSWNNRGYLLWKQGKSLEAVEWWKKAATAGDAQAKHNLAELEKRGL